MVSSLQSLWYMLIWKELDLLNNVHCVVHCQTSQMFHHLQDWCNLMYWWSLCLALVAVFVMYFVCVCVYTYLALEFTKSFLLYILGCWTQWWKSSCSCCNKHSVCSRSGTCTRSSVHLVHISMSKWLIWWYLQAIRRRFDKRIYIPLPDQKARQHMFKVLKMFLLHVFSGCRHFLYLLLY